MIDRHRISLARPVRVWDLPTRVFHWAFALLVLVGLLSGEDEGIVFAIHTMVGYFVLLGVLFRLGWGVVGTEHARFVDFVRRWPAVRCHALAVVALRPPRCIGHNPLGGWMIVTMLATILLVVVTGMLSGGEEGAPPGLLLRYLPRGLGEIFEEIHEGLANVLIVLVVLHVVGVVAHSLVMRENLIRAMIDGIRRVPEDDEAADIRPASRFWLVSLIALLGVLGGWLVAATDF